MADEFDALVHLVTRAILLSRRTAYVPGMETAASGVPDPEPFGREDPRRAGLDAFRGLAGIAGDQDANPNPFSGLCGAPCHWYGVVLNKERCRHAEHPRVVSSIEGCPDWAKWGSVREDKAMDDAANEMSRGGLHASP